MASIESVCLEPTVHEATNQRRKDRRGSPRKAVRGDAPRATAKPRSAAPFRARGSLQGTQIAALFSTQSPVVIERLLNNPFDLVPNIAGGNDLGLRGLTRSLKFRGLVFGDDPLASPHTLPYLGLETYVEQLSFTGHHELAKRAMQFHPSEMA